MTHSRLSALVAVAIMAAAMWLFEIIDWAAMGALDHTFGLRAWSTDAPWTIATAPFMHYGFPHLIGNSVPFLVLGGLVALSGMSRFVWTTIIVTVVSGVGVWLLSEPGTSTVGASGLIFGYFGYTVLRGIIERKTVDIVIMICVIIFYGTMIFGVVPQHAGISWQAHLFGFIGGLLAAYALPKRSERRASGTDYGGGYGRGHGIQRY